MTVYDWFFNHRLIKEGGELIEVQPLLFEIKTIEGIHNNRYNYIVKNRQMHVSNLMSNYVSWYAIENPNSRILYYNPSSHHWVSTYNFIEMVDGIKSFVGTGTAKRALLTNNNSIIEFSQLRSINDLSIHYGKNYDLLILDEVSFKADNLYDNLKHFKKIIIITSNTSYDTLEIWKNDIHFNKIALSVGQNYLKGINDVGRHQYNEWLAEIKPFKELENRINGFEEYDYD